MLKQPLYDKIARLDEAIGPLEQVLWNLQDHRSTRRDAGRSDGFALATDHLTKAVAALETERSETIWSLSCATTDPVARLPFEVSSKILLHLPSFYVDTAAKLLRVCRAWNRIAEATPHLWTVFRSARIASTKVENLLKLWLFRAYPLPVSLVLEHLDSYIRDILDENSHRAQNLTLLLTAEDSKRCNNEMRMISQRRSFGALRTLTIDSYEDPDTGRYSILDSPSNTLDMLRGMPNLEEFTFLCITHRYGLPFNTNILTLQSLRRLSLGKLVNEYGLTEVADGNIIRGLGLPALDFLHIQLKNHEDETHLLQMLARSSPPLRTLQLGIDEMSPTVLACLERVPRVTELDIRYGYAPISPRFFEALLNTPGLLPNLRHLRVFGLTDHPSVYTRALKALQHRKSRLRSFRLIARNEMTRSFPETLEPAFRKLMAEGMEIFIGEDFQCKNYLS